jgi:hypothetical protein
LALPTIEELIVNIHVDTSGAERDTDRLDKSLGNLTGRFNSLNAVMGLLRFSEIGSLVVQIIPAVNALGAGFVGLSTALAPMVGLLALLPAALLGVGSAATAGVLATAGLGDAFKAFDDVQKAAAPTLAETRAQLRAQEAAARALRNALERLADAERDLREALKPADVLDMRAAELALERARLANANAIADQAKAMEALNKATQLVYKSVTGIKDEFTGKTFEFVATVRADPGSKAEDLARKQLDAALRIKETQLAIELAERRIQDLKLIGTELDERVIDARRRLRNAIENVADAEERLKEARETADKNAIDAMEKLRQALAKLSPEGQRFVKLVQSFKPEFDTLRDHLQDIVFKGINDGLIIARFNAVRFKNMLKESGDVLSFLSGEFLKLMGDDEFGIRLERSLDPVNDAMTNIGIGMIHAIDGFVHVIDAARPLIDWAGDLGLKVGVIFENWAKAGNESGALRTAFEKAAETADTFFDILGNVWGAIRNVMSAAEPLGGWLFEKLRDTTQMWEDWTGSAENVSKMSQWFEDFKPLLSGIAGLTGDIIEAWITFGGNTNLGEMIEKFRSDLLPSLQNIFDHLSDMGPKFMGLAEAVIKLFEKLSETNVVMGPLIAGFTKVADIITWVLDHAPALGTFVSALAALAVIKKFDSIIHLSSSLGNMASIMGKSGGLARMVGDTGEKMKGLGGMATGAIGGVRGLLNSMSTGTAVAIGVAAIAAAWTNMTNKIQEAADAYKKDIESAEKNVKSYDDLISFQGKLQKASKETKDAAKEASKGMFSLFDADYISAMDKAADATDEQIKKNEPLIKSIEAVSSAFGISKSAAYDFVKAQEDLGVSVGDTETLLVNYADKIKGIAENEMKKLYDSTWDQIKNVDSFVEKGDDWRSAMISIEEATIGVTEASKENYDANEDGKLSLDELAKKNREVEKAEIAKREAVHTATEKAWKSAEAASNVAKAEHEAAGKIYTTKDAVIDQIKVLEDMRKGMDVNSPLYKSIGDTIGKLEDFKGRYEAELEVKTAEANRQLIKSLALLFMQSGAEVDANEQAKLIRMLERNGGNFGEFQRMMEDIGAWATGGRVEAGTLNLVGERGPELFMPAVSGTVLSHGETAARLGGMQATSLTRDDLRELVSEMQRSAKPIEVNVDAPQYATPEHLGRAVAWEIA